MDLSDLPSIVVPCPINPSGEDSLVHEATCRRLKLDESSLCSGSLALSLGYSRVASILGLLDRGQIILQLANLG